MLKDKLWRNSASCCPSYHVETISKGSLWLRQHQNRRTTKGAPRSCTKCWCRIHCLKACKSTAFEWTKWYVDEVYLNVFNLVVIVAKPSSPSQPMLLAFIMGCLLNALSKTRPTSRIARRSITGAIGRSVAVATTVGSHCLGSTRSHWSVTSSQSTTTVFRPQRCAEGGRATGCPTRDSSPTSFTRTRRRRTSGYQGPLKFKDISISALWRPL